MSIRRGTRLLVPGLLFLVLSCGAALAANLPSSALQGAGRRWFALVTGVPESSVVVSGGFVLLQDGAPVLYAVNFQPRGYVLLSCSDAAFPVLAYSREGTWTGRDLPAALQDWLRFRKAEAATLIRRGIPPSDKARRLWQALLPESRASLPRALAAAPLLATTWNEGTPYNAQCPADAAGPGGRAWAGGVAAALGQVLKKWAYPATGEGSHSYVHPTYGTLSANFGATTYDWASMPDALTGANAAVAQLLAQCGVAVDTSYGPTRSDASLAAVPAALRSYFRYSRAAFRIAKDAFPNDAAWDQVLRSELDHGRPVLYGGTNVSGVTRAFVVDGYELSDFFHVNWGQGGAGDGYFYLQGTSSLLPYPNAQEAVRSIVPETLMPERPYYTLNHEIPHEVVAGTPFEVDVTATNQSGVDANSGAIVVAFPQFNAAGDKDFVEPDDATGYSETAAGQTTVMRAGYTRTIDHLFVKSELSPWPAGATRHLVLHVRPQQTGTFKVLVRAELQKDGATVNYPASGVTVDQNGWEAVVHYVTVVTALSSLSVTPGDGLAASGPKGGPFTPAAKTYTLQNTGAGALDWAASKGQSWLTVSPTSGSLAAGATVEVTATLNSNANSLPAGTHAGSVTFTNLVNHLGDTVRPVTLGVGGTITEATLTVRSSPDAGAAIAVSPADKSGRGDGTTEFTRTYATGTAVTLTAPETFSGQPFQSWMVDAEAPQAARTITVPMTAAHTAVAAFGTSRPLPLVESFDATGLPAGWTQQGVGASDRLWTVSDTNLAGLSPNEARCRYQAATGTTRLVSPPLNTIGLSSFVLRFNHYFDAYMAGVTLKVQSSADGTTWTDEAWSVANPAAPIGPAVVAFPVTHNLGIATTYVAFVVTGMLDRFYGWHIDGVSMTKGALIPPELTSPAPGAAGVTSPVTLRWTDPNTAESYYQVRVKTEGGTYTYLSLPQNTTSRSMTVATDTTYYWNVRARGDSTNLTSDWANGGVDRKFRTGKVALAAPELSQPANGTTGLASPVTLRWTDPNSAPQEASYTIRVKPAGGAYSYQTAAADATSLALPLAAGTYSWNVQAVGDDTTTTSSAWANGGTDWTLTVGAATLTAPGLTSPADNAAGLAFPVALGWTDPNSSPQEASYKIRVRAEGGAYAYYTAAQNATGYSLGSLPGSVFYWNVQAVAGDGSTSDWGNGGTDRKFTVGKAALAAPALSAPANNTPGGLTSPVTLTWTDPNSAPQETGYRIRIRAEGATTYTLYNVGANVVSKAVAVTLNKTYYWNVRAVGNGTTTNNSAWANGGADWKFRTGSVVLATPALAAPTNGATGVASPATLRWSDPNGAPQEASFSVRYRKAGTTTYTFVTVAQNVVTYALPAAAGTTYSWNVRAIGNGTTVLSSAWANGGTDWTFTSSGGGGGPTVLVAPVLSAPANGATGLTSPVTVRWSDPNSAPQETSYQIRLKASSGAYYYYTVAQNAVSKGFPVTSGVTYSWCVRAVGNGSTTTDSPWANGGTDWTFKAK